MIVRRCNISTFLVGTLTDWNFSMGSSGFFLEIDNTNITFKIGNKGLASVVNIYANEPTFDPIWSQLS